jgi:N-carbamoylputrescine amidase
MSSMKVTVCEMSDDRITFEREWLELVAHVRSQKSELVLLPEMPFDVWFGTSSTFDERVWQATVDAHARSQSRLDELSPATVLSTSPVNREGARANEAFFWKENIYTGVHSKYYLPDEPGFFEASWYERGDGSFTPVQCGPASVGFAICTEIWAFDRSSRYGKQGVHIIATPRATANTSVEKWVVGGRAAAISAGAYCLSSNRKGLSKDKKFAFGGTGWIIDPDGKVLALTSSDEPFATIEIDLNAAEEAKSTYPRYAL